MFRVVLANGDNAFAETTGGAELAARTLVREAKTVGLSDDRIHVLVGDGIDSAVWTTVLAGVKPCEVEAGLRERSPVTNLLRGEWV